MTNPYTGEEGVPLDEPGGAALPPDVDRELPTDPDPDVEREEPPGRENPPEPPD